MLIALAQAQKLVLFLHFGKRRRQAADYALVRHMIGVGVDQQPKVEDELVALILRVTNDHGVTKDRIPTIGRVDCDIAVAERLSRDDVLVEHVKVDERRPRAALRGCNASWW